MYVTYMYVYVCYVYVCICMLRICRYGGDWKDKEKRGELLEDRAQYLIAKTSTGEPVGFCHFRFDMDYDLAVIYWSVLIYSPQTEYIIV